MFIRGSGYCPAVYRQARGASPLAAVEVGAAGVGEGAALGHMVGGEGGRVSRKRYFFSSPLPLTISSVRTPLQVLYVSIFFYNCYKH